MSTVNSFCRDCVAETCEGICKLTYDYCDDCGGKCDGCCRKGEPSTTVDEQVADALRVVFSNNDEFVQAFCKAICSGI